MAVAVPLLMMAGGAATTTALMVSVAFAVTGINDKINKAAAGVFGEDLVKVANVVGVVYGAYEAGAFDGLSGVSAGADAAAIGEFGLPNYAVMPDPSAAIGTFGLPNYAVMPDPSAAIGEFGLPNYAVMPDPAASAGFDLGGGITDGGLGQTTNGTSSLANGANGTKVMGTTNTSRGLGDTVARSDAPYVKGTTDYATKIDYSLASAPNASGAGASGLQATGSNATALNRLATKPPPDTGFLQKLQAGAEKLADKPYVMAGLAQGVAGGYSAAQTRAIEEAKLDYQRKVANIGSAGWVQTQ
jgi:hypothetical protein